MSFAFENDKWSQDAAAAADEGRSLSQLEWTGLRARMIAAREARRVIDRVAIGALGNVGGSFDRDTARRLGGFETFCTAVNLKDSTNRKPARPIDSHVVGTSSTGDRG